MKVVNSITELRTVSSAEFSHAFACGYHQAGDGGGGNYCIDPADTTGGDNGGTVIVATDGGRWKLVHQGAVSIKQFGAKVDGTTDDEAAVQAAINAVSHVCFPPGTCKINSTLTLRSHQCIELAPDAVIDFSGAGRNATLFLGSGTLGPYLPLTATGVAGSRTITVGSTAGFYVRDWIKIKAETLFSSSPDAAIGEINRIAEGNSAIPGDELTATSIPLVADLQSTYDANAGAAVARLTLVENVTICGGTLRGAPTDDNAQAAVDLTYALNCHVENVTIEQFDRHGVGCNNCIGTTVAGCRFYNERAITTGYGVSFSGAAADCIAATNHFDEVAHAMTATAIAVDHGIPRRILFSNNVVRNSSWRDGAGGDAIDTHRAGEDISIIGNTVLSSSGNGIHVECPTAVIIGNTINDSHDNAIQVENNANIDGGVLIANNRIERCGLHGIAVGQGDQSAYTEIVIQGNTVELAERGISVRASTTYPIVSRDVSITGNSIRDTRGDGINVFAIRCGAITGNSLSKIAGCGIKGDSLDSVSISGNSVVILPSPDEEQVGIKLSEDSAGGKSDHCSIVGNTIALNSGTTTKPGIKLDGVTHTAVVANVIRGFQGVQLGSDEGNIQANNI